jgi:hypothetical protein
MFELFGVVVWENAAGRRTPRRKPTRPCSSCLIPLALFLGGVAERGSRVTDSWQLTHE